MFPVENGRFNPYDMQNLSIPTQKMEKLDPDSDKALKNLLEIEKLNKQTEEDVMVYSFMT